MGNEKPRSDIPISEKTGLNIIRMGRQILSELFNDIAESRVKFSQIIRWAFLKWKKWKRACCTNVRGKLATIQWINTVRRNSESLFPVIIRSAIWKRAVYESKSEEKLIFMNLLIVTLVREAFCSDFEILLRATKSDLMEELNLWNAMKCPTKFASKLTSTVKGRVINRASDIVRLTFCDKDIWEYSWKEKIFKRLERRKVRNTWVEWIQKNLSKLVQTGQFDGITWQFSECLGDTSTSRDVYKEVGTIWPRDPQFSKSDPIDSSINQWNRIWFRDLYCSKRTLKLKLVFNGTEISEIQKIPKNHIHNTVNFRHILTNNRKVESVACHTVGEAEIRKNTIERSENPRGKEFPQWFTTNIRKNVKLRNFSILAGFVSLW
jgi:hypothetical protein